jgi:hypothetical protein
VRAFLDAIAYRPAVPAPPDLAPCELAVTAAEAARQNVLAADFADIDPQGFRQKLAESVARVEKAEEALRLAREAAGLDDERLTLADRWGSMTIPERRRALHAFGVVAHVERGSRQSINGRVNIELSADPVGDGWEPDVRYEWPSIDPGRIAAWQARYANAKITISPVVLSDEDEALADKIFGVASRRQSAPPRKRT